MRNSETPISGVFYANFSLFMGQGLTERSNRAYVLRLATMLYGVSIFNGGNVEGGVQKPLPMILFSHERATVHLL
jgi:hypothetical protein